MQSIKCGTPKNDNKCYKNLLEQNQINENDEFEEDDEYNISDSNSNKISR